MDHAEKARALFLEGYNCAQAVLCAFDDMTGLDRETSARLASSFGGGMGRMREVCGTVSGALLVLGQLSCCRVSGQSPEMIRRPGQKSITPPDPVCGMSVKRRKSWSSCCVR